MESTSTSTKTIDLVARLLATENLSVERRSASTASFNLKTRVLTIPIWTNIEKEVEEMLIGHEIGHALYTHLQEFDVICKAGLNLGYFNIIEDARIEKLVKRKYPGIKKTFFAGYRIIHEERDLFKIKDSTPEAIAKMGLIDRINIHFKVPTISVPFNDDEFVFVERTANAETMQDVASIVNDIVEYVKNKKEPEKEEKDEKNDAHGGTSDKHSNSYNKQDDESESESESDDGDDDESDDTDDETGTSAQSNATSETDVHDDKNGKSSLVEENADDIIEGSSPSAYPEKENPVPEAMTSKAITDYTDAALGGTGTTYYSFTSNLHTTDEESIIIDYTQILEETKECIKKCSKTPYTSMLDAAKPVVNYLHKEFEMKKAASGYARVRTSKTGVLNMNKIHGYKTSPNLFKNLTIVPNDQNHGMIFLLDWSSSMQRTMHKTLDQLLPLLMFCRRSNIPFEVFAFTSGRALDESYKATSGEYRASRIKIGGDPRVMIDTSNYHQIACSQKFHLLNFFSSRMNEHEFVTMSTMIYGIYYLDSRYRLNNTPLNEALMFMLKYIPMFQSMHHVEKTIFITLTDGGGQQLQILESEIESKKTDFKKNIARVVDPVTKSAYDVTSHRTSLHGFQSVYLNGAVLNRTTLILYKMIQDRYNTVNLSFQILNSGFDLKEAVSLNIWGEMKRSVYDKLMSDLSKNKFVEMQAFGRDRFFALNGKAMDSVNESGIESVTADMTAAKVAQSLSKGMKKKRSSRVLLSSFIDLIA